MDQPWLFAIDYILSLDGLGLIILRRYVKLDYIMSQGIFQLATGIFGAIIQCQHYWDDYGLIWFAILSVVLLSKWFLHRQLARNDRLLQNVTLNTEYLSPEMYAYLILSMFIYYLNLAEICKAPVWGVVAWYLCFGTSAVLLGTLGGVGLLTVARGKLIRYFLRVVTTAGVVGLVLGCLGVVW